MSAVNELERPLPEHVIATRHNPMSRTTRRQQANHNRQTSQRIPQTTDTPDKTLTVNNHSNTLHTNIRTANTPHPHHTPVAAA